MHETGHILGAWLTGGEVNRIVLCPWAFSRTDVEPNPHPLIVVWSGPVIGCVLPVIIYLIVRFLKWPGWYLYRFFAGFCLIANGLYISVGAFEKLADAGDMLRYGSPVWFLILFGGLTVPMGFVMWNGLGRHFGLGDAGGDVSKTAARVSLILFLIILISELVLSTV